MLKRIVLVVFVLLYSLLYHSYAQNSFGNEWMVKTQSYWRLKVGSTGIQRLNRTQLQLAGVPLNSNPVNWQLWWRGVQVPMYIAGEADGTFDMQDYVEFFGQINDGALDSLLYANKSHQAHPFHSLFADTSVYFLTIANQPGLRYQPINGTVITDTFELWHAERLLFPFVNRYNLGIPVAANATLSDYTFAEGWMGSVIGLGGSFARNYSLSGIVRGVAPVTSRVRIFAISNAPAQGANPNHHIRLAFSLTNNQTPAPYLDTTFRGHALLDRQFVINQADVAANGNTRIRFEVVNDLGVSADNHSISSIEFSYPRNFNLNVSSTRQFFVNSTKAAVALRFTRYDTAGNKRNPVIYDLSNSRRISVRLSNDTVTGMVQLNSQANLILADSLDAFSPIIQPINYPLFDVTNANFDYLIVTHKSLLTGAESYANYRQSNAGGSFKPLIITTEQLYDQFFFGISFHPLAIRNFINLLLNQAPTTPRFLLLLGKGFEGTFRNDSLRMAQNMVPSYGVPASDHMLTAGLNGTFLQPAIPTGRIAAFNNNQIFSYLNKLISYESAPPSQWQKEVMHVSGGVNDAEKDRFANHLRQFASHLTRPFWGAKIHVYDKVTSSAITVDPKTFIQSRINQGIGLYSYFGHGSASAIGVDFGFPSDLQNTGKYPIMLFNGCGVGDAFTTSSIGESFIFEPNKGAIAWLATSDLGFETFLRSFADIFYQQIGWRAYGAKLGENIRATIAQFQASGSAINRLHCQQYIFQGDPALKTYNFDLPDLSIVPSDIYFAPRNPTATLDSFRVYAIINNLGMAVQDSINVALVRTLPNGTAQAPLVKRISAPFFRDTVDFLITDQQIGYRGNNRFEIIIDAQNQLQEVTKANNRAFLDYFMPTNGVNLLYPLPYATISSSQVKLQAQSGNMLLKGVRFFFELDTTPLFNSAFLQRQQVLPTQNLGEVDFYLPLADSIAYYWRARLDLPLVDGGGWEARSFFKVNQIDTAINFIQATHRQRENMATTGLVWEQGNFEFLPVSRELRVGTSGFNQAQALSFRNGDINLSTGSNCGDFASAAIVEPISFFAPSFQSACNLRPAMNFRIQDSTGLQALITFIDTMPMGHHFMFATFNRGAHFLSRNPDVFRALASVGADTLLLKSIDTITSDVTPRVAFAMIGTKGMTMGQAFQDTAIANSRVLDRGVLVRRDVMSRGVQGSYLSEKIGPAKQWNRLQCALDLRDNSPSDSINLQVWGIDLNNNKSLIASHLPPDTLLNGLIDASVFPYIELQVHAYDSLKRTAPNIKYWKINYQSLPEATVIIDQDFNLHKDSLQQGDSLRLSYKIRNLSIYPTDTTLIRYTLIDNNRQQTLLQTDTLFPMTPGTQLPLKMRANSNNWEGKYDLAIEVLRPNFFSDLYNFNNLFQQSFQVFKDPFNPALDVTFDGVRIMNGDLVAATPEILIQSLDENKFFLQNDTSQFEISLKKPGSFQFERVYFNSGLLTFLPANQSKNLAQVYFRPVELMDGAYELQVQVKDITGNLAGNKPFRINFKVINKSSISHFYTYPNPFSTQTRFVFTLTGNELPDDILIKIYTISGKVVREITRNELGSIRIGNNVSDFVWDGTDQFGDKLANGVYFYRVEVRSKGKNMERFETAGDKFFNKDLGKIYLMR